MQIHFSVCAGLFEIPSGMLNVTAVIHTHSVRAIKFSRAIVLGQKIEWIADENTKVYFLSLTQLDQTIELCINIFLFGDFGVFSTELRTNCSEMVKQFPFL